jgi:hypothetical protein
VLQIYDAKMQDVNQTAEFFLANYRLGKTLGIGSFGKVMLMSVPLQQVSPALLQPFSPAEHSSDPDCCLPASKSCSRCT